MFLSLLSCCCHHCVVFVIISLLLSPLYHCYCCRCGCCCCHHCGCCCCCCCHHCCCHHHCCHGHHIVVASWLWSDHGWGGHKSVVEPQALNSKSVVNCEGRYKQEQKNNCTYPSSCVAKGLCCAVQLLQPLLLLDRGGALEREDRHLHQQGGSRIGEHGLPLNEIANEKKRYCTQDYMQLMSRSMSVSVCMIARQCSIALARRTKGQYATKVT